MPSEKKTETAAKKLSILQVILLEEKKILFAPFSSKVTHAEKMNSWEKVLLKAKSIGMVSENRDWKFVRDKLFSVWKSRTMSKRDNANTTGSEGGVDKVLDEVDLKILEIIDKKSPVLNGLGITETGAHVTGVCSVIGDSCDVDGSNEIKEIAEENKRKRKLSQVAASEPNTEKDKLTLELMAVEVYHRRLQCLKLERELGLGPSQFTETILPKTITVQNENDLEDATIEVDSLPRLILHYV